jgi:hypothetical protein
MHDIGGLVWIIIVAIAVISSIRRNVQRVRNAQLAQSQQMQQAQKPPPPPVAAPPLRMAPAPAPAVEVAPVVPPPVAPPKIAVAPSPTMPFPMPAPVGTSPIRGMFGGSTTLVRAIVAAEVLGQPIALQEHLIWSQRHSEPSI